MRSIGHALLGLAVLTAAGSIVRGVQLAPAVPGTPSNFVIVDAPHPNPFAGATLLDSVTSPAFQVFGTSNITHQQLLKATGSVTTTVYRTTSGTVGFAYTINSQGFKDPLDPADFVNGYIPSFSVSGFGNQTVDVSADSVPGFTGSGNSTLAVREAQNNDVLKFLFIRESAPIQSTAFWDFPAGSPALTLYVQTNAQAYQSISATLSMSLLEERSKIPFAGSDFDVPSFSVAESAAPGIPEPMSLGTLALSVAALAVRRWRKW